MTKFRPPDWENIKAREWDKVARLPFKENIFEAGADTMLKSLREDGIENNSQCHSTLQFPQGGSITDIKKGKWVFIPDDRD